MAKCVTEVTQRLDVDVMQSRLEQQHTRET